jgi:hypothetical protein
MVNDWVSGRRARAHVEHIPVGHIYDLKASRPAGGTCSTWNEYYECCCDCDECAVHVLALPQIELIIGKIPALAYDFAIIETKCDLDGSVLSTVRTVH